MMITRRTLIRVLSSENYKCISSRAELNCYKSLSKALRIREATTFQSLSIRHLSSSSSSSPNWYQVNNYCDLILQAKQALQSPTTSSTNPRRHWLVVLHINAADFATHHHLFLFYVKTLARVLPSEEEAKKKIYLVSCELCFGFGAEIDEATKYKLEVEQGVAFVLEDYYYDTRKKDLRVCSDPQFTMVDRNHQLLDIFSYQYLSATISDCKSNYWLVHVNPPESGFNSERETIEFCYHLLSEVVGSPSFIDLWLEMEHLQNKKNDVEGMKGNTPTYNVSEEEARKKIYIIWCKTPFGFAAEIDEDTSNKLKGRPDVLMVFPDYAFSAKKKNSNVLVVAPPSTSKLDFIGTYMYCFLPDLYLEDSDNPDDDDEDSDYLMKIPVDESPASNTSSKFPVCKRWFVAMEKPGGEIGSWQERIDCYIRTLAAVIGSVEAAKEKIYRVICEDQFFGFGAEIDEVSVNKLKGLSGVLDVFPDYLFNKDHKGVDLSDGEIFRSTLEEMTMDLRGWAMESK